MTSDYIPPTRNAVCWDNSTTPSPKICREKKTLVSTVESYHLLVMTLCGFMKGEEQSLCHSVCKMGKKDEEAITPGKLQPKWGIKLRGHWGRWGNSSKLESEKQHQISNTWFSDHLSQYRKECWCWSEIFAFTILSYSISFYLDSFPLKIDVYFLPHSGTLRCK